MKHVSLFDRQHHMGGKITKTSKTCGREASCCRLCRVEIKKKESGPLGVLGTDPACRFRMRCQILSAVAGRGQKAGDANESESGRCCGGSDGAERGGKGGVNPREGQSLGGGEADRRSRGGGVEKLLSRQLITGNVAPHLSRGK